MAVPGRLPRCQVLLLLLACCLQGDSGFSETALTMLHDSQGWEYIAVFDQDNGVQAKHDCFVEGQSNRDACHGTLTFGSDGTFQQDVYIHGTLVQRHGTYQLSDKTVTLFDELGTQDGPYNLEIKLDAKTLRMSTRQAGVLVGADFQLETEYKKQQDQKNQGQKNQERVGRFGDLSPNRYLDIFFLFVRPTLGLCPVEHFLTTDAIGCPRHGLQSFFRNVFFAKQARSEFPVVHTGQGCFHIS
jgi:hypothetical protein